MIGLQELLLNILFLIVFFLFIPLIVELKYTNHSKKKVKAIKLISYILAIISCIQFPVTYFHNFIYDLRLIAVVLGGLCGGVITSTILCIFTILYRFLFDGIGIMITILIMIPTFIFLLIFSKEFNHFSRGKKIIVSTCIIVTTSFFGSMIAKYYYGLSISHSFTIFYLAINCLATISIVYLHDVFKESIYFRQAIIKSEKMELVSHLASSISHEVKNPLAVVRGFLQMMQESDLEEAKRKHFLSICIQEIDRADKIIRNYLTFAKPAPENEKQLNIKHELLKAIDIITPLAHMNSVIINLTAQSYFINGESQLLQQALLNICKNCIEAMPHSGTLNIQTSKLKNQVMITISDTGIGMTKEQLARMGEPYFTTKGRAGTGLGMMAAIQIIHSLRGKIDVKSEWNKGTTFYLSFPLLVDKQVSIKKGTI
ncbi:HAMP domain-containing sensor histidine kinase [Niallia sp.]|uniref:HAMP domain-containing sensor histidine kinase n=1 Tax=Niallia sp. TaxID=2837523 RepID=UPI0028A1FDA0|nr:HAMP domain-containing sensor histidine kinase [Niallia sp.]